MIKINNQNVYIVGESENQNVMHAFDLSFMLEDLFIVTYVYAPPTILIKHQNKNQRAFTLIKCLGQEN